VLFHAGRLPGSSSAHRTGTCSGLWGRPGAADVWQNFLCRFFGRSGVDLQPVRLRSFNQAKCTCRR
jgi:hypothetical protein